VAAVNRTAPNRIGLLATLLAAVVVAGTGCGRPPDRTLDPAAPTVTYTPLHRPFAATTLAVDPSTQALRWQRQQRADWLAPITTQPQARWLNSFQDLAELDGYLDSARRQGALPVLVAYFIPNRGCSGFREGAPYSDVGAATPRPDSYAAWISLLVRRLGTVRSAVVLEPDAVAADCFDAERAAALRAAVTRLVAAGQYVYLDAGHPNWVKSGPMAQRLLESGVAAAEGVALNVSNRYPTPMVAEYGEELSDLIGGRDYLVDVGRNGSASGAGDPAAVADDWCNRPDQALGRQQLDSPDPARWPHLAAALWIKPPGESDGNQAVFPGQDCHGESAPPGVFSLRQARQLIVNDPRQPESVRARVRAIDPPEQR
jgi:endoglucanase